MPMRSQPRTVATGLVRVSLVARDDRGFTHVYEELETTPAAVRDAFDLMARHTAIETETPDHRSALPDLAALRNEDEPRMSF
jgi:hypothetical protein